MQNGLDDNDDEEAKKTSENILQRNANFLNELASPEVYSSAATSDIERIQRTLDFILGLALEAENFARFGSDAFRYSLSDNCMKSVIVFV
jgi:hypothetical protein